jgi:hypothetical protein
MSYELIGKIWLVILCAPGIVPAAIFYKRHCKQTPRGENRFPLGLYVTALLICAFVAFWGGTEWGVRFACSAPSSGNLCGLLGLIVVGPLSSIMAVSVISWLIIHFPSQLKYLAVAGIALFVLASGYYFRNFFSDIVPHQDLYQYTLQFGNADEIRRFAPVIEAQMRRLPALKDVSLNSQLKGHQTIANVELQKAAPPGVKGLPMATMTISFRLAQGVALSDAIAQIQVMTGRLMLPATITTSLTKAPSRAAISRQKDTR